MELLRVGSFGLEAYDLKYMHTMLKSYADHPVGPQSMAAATGIPVITITEQIEPWLMKAGLLRRTDPGAATRCFIGPLLGYVLTREIFPLPDALTLTPETMVAITVDTFLRGMDYQYPTQEHD
jgi:hypothetical protein